VKFYSCNRYQSLSRLLLQAGTWLSLKQFMPPECTRTRHFILKIFWGGAVVYLAFIFIWHFITNFPQTECAGGKVWKSVNIWRRYGQKFAAYFWATLYVHRPICIVLWMFCDRVPLCWRQCRHCETALGANVSMWALTTNSRRWCHCRPSLTVYNLLSHQRRV